MTTGQCGRRSDHCRTLGVYFRTLLHVAVSTQYNGGHWLYVLVYEIHITLLFQFLSIIVHSATRNLNCTVLIVLLSTEAV